MSIDLSDLIARARAAGTTISAAESCTGGLISAALTAAPGSSAVFECGFVTYSNRAKMNLIGVRNDTLATHGAVSEDVARQMADGARQRAGTTLAIAVTGIAGPGGSDFKPEGRVCFALSQLGQRTAVETVEFGPLGRDAVRQATCDHALRLLDHAIS